MESGWLVRHYGNNTVDPFLFHSHARFSLGASDDPYVHQKKTLYEAHSGVYRISRFGSIGILCCRLHSYRSAVREFWRIIHESERLYQSGLDTRFAAAKTENLIAI